MLETKNMMALFQKNWSFSTTLYCHTEYFLLLPDEMLKLVVFVEDQQQQYFLVL